VKILGRDVLIGDRIWDARAGAHGADRRITGWEMRRTRPSLARVALCGRWQMAILDDVLYEVRREVSPEVPLITEELLDIDNLANVCSPAPAELTAVLHRIMEATKANLPPREAAEIVSMPNLFICPDPACGLGWYDGRQSCDHRIRMSDPESAYRRPTGDAA
jgi:hypothetical protein